MKYLVVTEGKRYKIIDSEEKLNKYLENLAKEEKARGVKKTDQWLKEMKENRFSHIYTVFPEFILSFEENDFDKI